MKDKVLNIIKSIKFFNCWSLFYAVILFIAAIYNYVYNFQYYSFADVFINYQGGFVRRGLMGDTDWVSIRCIQHCCCALSPI